MKHLFKINAGENDIFIEEIIDNKVKFTVRNSIGVAISPTDTSDINIQGNNVMLKFGAIPVNMFQKITEILS